MVGMPALIVFGLLAIMFVVLIGLNRGFARRRRRIRGDFPYGADAPFIGDAGSSHHHHGHHDGGGFGGHHGGGFSGGHHG